ncbi:YtxH domain-containing protein [Myxococcus sp. AM001]|uniref:YtxH domain-containing protein n=1 Tax=Myxococcus TaxID=32 RepID=UPI0013D0A20D|nr:MULTISPECIES: YtxH domain-containing protein [Myxococcus]NVI98680.1 YtxH domain-containing protein [Myxococcus sp. AM009]NVJ10160.1 YtxH domain-containing protein [Myxococcus sp. AM001]NVJ13285.1 YtxH domain-containing protein [Myxococcus sp. AM010]WIG93351.1 YtxH domain-containing protein [Myxococcus sp. SDU36]
MLKNLLMAAALGVLVVGTGCHRNTRESAESDAERAVDKTEDAAEEAGDKIEDTAEEAGDEIEDATDD